MSSSIKTKKRVLGQKLMSNKRDADVEREGESSNFKKLKSSAGHLTNAGELVFRSCYSSTTGVRFTKDECEKNIRNALKNSDSTSWFSMIELSDRDGIRGTPTSEVCRILALDMFQRQEKRKTEKVARVKPRPAAENAKLFDLESAHAVDNVVALPGCRRLHISSLLTPAAISAWVGLSLEKAVEKCAITIYGKICERDEFALVYGAPQSNRSCRYPKLDDIVFDNFAIVVRAGFGIEEEKWSLPTLTASLKSTIRNLLNRERSKCPKHVEEKLNEFLSQLKTDENFQQHRSIIGNIAFETPDTLDGTDQNLVKEGETGADGAAETGDDGAGDGGTDENGEDGEQENFATSDDELNEEDENVVVD